MVKKVKPILLYSFIFCISTLSYLPAAQGARFATQFIEFELPTGWTCSLDKIEWVCSAQNAEKRKEAIIVLAAKLKQEKDRLDLYYAHLETPKIYKSIRGDSIESKVLSVGYNKINDQRWVDAIHLNSEIPDYQTRYLATTIEDIAIVVTYSIHKDKIKEYEKIFENLLSSLKAFRKPLTASEEKALLDVPNDISEKSVFPEVAFKDGVYNPQEQKSLLDQKTFGIENFWLLLIAICTVVIIVIKKRKQ